MHVVLVPSFYPNPARPLAGTFFREQARALRNAGLRVGVLACLEKAPWQAPRGPGRWPGGVRWEDDGGVATLRGLRVRLLPGYHWPRLRRWVRYGARIFEAYIDRHGVPDIFHAHIADPAGLLAAELKSRHNVPVVLTEHATWLASGSGGRFRDSVAEAGIRAADAGIVVSPALGDRLSRRLPCPKGGWRWIPNLVDQAFLDPPIAPRGPASGRRFTFLSVSWLVPRKGHDILLRAFAMAFRGEREVSLRIGGSGESEASLRRLAAQLQIEHRVEFLGALERDRLVKELGDCDAFVLASRLETFGVAVIEALALGRAVIATRCGGPEYIVRKEDGILVDAEDVEGLASALRQMSEQASRYDPEALRRGVVERFGPETVARQIIDVYRDLLGGNG